MIAHLLSVIGGEDDQRIVPASGLFQKVEETAQRRINLAHQTVVDGLEPAHFLVVAARPILAPRELIGEPGMLGRLVLRRAQARKAGHGHRVVHGIVWFRGDERRMRTQNR